MFTGVMLLSFQLKSCSCLGIPSMKHSLKKSDVAVIGTVSNIEKVKILDEGYLEITGDSIFSSSYHKVEIAIEVMLKGGRKKQKSIYIWTGLGNGDCGFPFEKGMKYLIFAGKEKMGCLGKQLSTNICTITSLYSEELLQELLAFRKYRQKMTSVYAL